MEDCEDTDREVGASSTNEIGEDDKEKGKDVSTHRREDCRTSGEGLHPRPRQSPSFNSSLLGFLNPSQIRRYRKVAEKEAKEVKTFGAELRSKSPEKRLWINKRDLHPQPRQRPSFNSTLLGFLNPTQIRRYAIKEAKVKTLEDELRKQSYYDLEVIDFPNDVSQGLHRKDKHPQVKRTKSSPCYLNEVKSSETIHLEETMRSSKNSIESSFAVYPVSTASAPPEDTTDDCIIVASEPPEDTSDDCIIVTSGPPEDTSDDCVITSCNISGTGDLEDDQTDNGEQEDPIEIKPHLLNFINRFCTNKDLNLVHNEIRSHMEEMKAILGHINMPITLEFLTSIFNNRKLLEQLKNLKDPVQPPKLTGSSASTGGL